MANEAETTGEPKNSGGRSLTWLWMILSLVVVGGFLVWLGAASEPTDVTVAEVDEGEDAGPVDLDVPLVSKDSLAASKATYEGERIRIEAVEATGQLGPAIFWGELGDRTNQIPILVRLDSAVAEGWQMQQGTRYDLTGWVQPMTDSVAAVWGEQGEFTGEGEQTQATFTDYFIQASRIRPSRGSASGESESGAGAAAGNGGG